MNDQPIFEVQYVEKRSRLTTFFRYFLVLPHILVLCVWGFAAFFALILAWFALVITGRYPEGLYSFVGGALRYGTAVSSYYYLLTDKYPPFSAETDDYPAHLVLPGPLPEYNRLHAAFRLITAIPPYIIAYAMGIVAALGAFLAWFVIVVTGKQPKGLQDMIVLGVSYQQRAYSYFLLLTEKWPAFTDQQGGSIEGTPSASNLPPAPPTSAPPAAPEAPRGTGGISSGDPLDG